MEKIILINKDRNGFLMGTYFKDLIYAKLIPFKAF